MSFDNELLKKVETLVGCIPKLNAAYYAASFNEGDDLLKASGFDTLVGKLPEGVSYKKDVSKLVSSMGDAAIKALSEENVMASPETPSQAGRMMYLPDAAAKGELYHDDYAKLQPIPERSRSLSQEQLMEEITGEVGATIECYGKAALALPDGFAEELAVVEQAISNSIEEHCKQFVATQ